MLFKIHYSPFIFYTEFVFHSNAFQQLLCRSNLKERKKGLRFPLYARKEIDFSRIREFNHCDCGLPACNLASFLPAEIRLGS